MAFAVEVAATFAMTEAAAIAFAMAAVIEVVGTAGFPVAGRAVDFAAFVAVGKSKSVGGLLVGDGTMLAAGRAVWA